MITSMDLAIRSREQVARFFDGMDLVEPGLVRLKEWRPGPATGDAGEGTLWCAVARKRSPAASGPRTWRRLELSQPGRSRHPRLRPG